VAGVTARRLALERDWPSSSPPSNSNCSRDQADAAKEKPVETAWVVRRLAAPIAILATVLSAAVMAPGALAAAPQYLPNVSVRDQCGSFSGVVQWGRRDGNTVPFIQVSTSSRSSREGLQNWCSSPITLVLFYKNGPLSFLESQMSQQIAQTRSSTSVNYPISDPPLTLFNFGDIGVQLVTKYPDGTQVTSPEVSVTAHPSEVAPAPAQSGQPVLVAKPVTTHVPQRNRHRPNPAPAPPAPAPAPAPATAPAPVPATATAPAPAPAPAPSPYPKTETLNATPGSCTVGNASLSATAQITLENATQLKWDNITLSGTAGVGARVDLMVDGTNSIWTEAAHWSGHTGQSWNLNPVEPIAASKLWVAGVFPGTSTSCGITIYPHN
jgi:hypothetical protein